MRPEEKFNITEEDGNCFYVYRAKNNEEYIIYGMKLRIKPNKYVAAVSGGVDSVVLLHLMRAELPKDKLVVAHFDHGIRTSSKEDRKFVEKLAEKYGLPYFYEEGRLGANASEALAREKRYEFLEKIKNQEKAAAITTAHHEDDLLETVVINLLRGTGRRGLSSLKSRPGLVRPLLKYGKTDILDYADKNNLQWREDETNKDEKYLRNYVRHKLMSRLSNAQKKKLLKLAEEAGERNEEIDAMIDNLLFAKDELPRTWLGSLSHNVAAEVIAQWLRKHGARLDKKTIEKLTIRLKTAEESKQIQASRGIYFVVEEGSVRIKKSGVV